MTVTLPVTSTLSAIPRGNIHAAARAAALGLFRAAEAAEAAGVTLSALRDYMRAGTPSARAARSPLGVSAWHALRQSARLYDGGERARTLVATARDRGISWEAIAEPFDLAPDTLRRKLREAVDHG